MGGRPRNSTPAPPRAELATATPENASKIAALLAEQWPDAVCELDHQNAYQLLVATILSAQSTDKMINTITPALFAKYPDCRALAAAEPAELEPMIYKSGFYRNKAKSLIGMARACVERHGGEIPQTMEELVQLPGVARKTANVVLGTAMGKNEGIVVDTHVMRVAQRLGLTRETDPIKIEQDLMRLIPRDQWTIFAHRMIWHGRRVCTAKNPDHDHCILAPLCPTAALVKLEGRKPGKPAASMKPGKPAPSARSTKPAKLAAPAKRAKKATKGAAAAKPAKPAKPAKVRAR